MSNLKLLGHAQQMSLSYQMRTQLREVAFLESGEALVERLSRNQAEHGITQKFEQFVIAGAGRRAQGLHLARLRAVGQGLLDQFAALEVVSEAFFQRNDFA